jgi:ClpX C4-type zinc finger
MDETLLAEARQAQERLIDAERDADVARADFHRAVRRLHLHGASLRELAGALGLSHQRVHQIVESAGGSRRWLRGHRQSRPAPELICTFCGQPKEPAGQLIAGPGVFICQACVPLARDVIATGQPGGDPFVPVIAGPELSQPGYGPRVKVACSFCGKRVDQVPGLAASSALIGSSSAKGGYQPRATVCIECLDLCDEIFAEQSSENGNPA